MAPGHNPQLSQAVFCLHGIRTRGEWTKDVTPLLSRAGFTPVPLDYGHVSARQLLSSRARREKVDWLRDKISRECDRLQTDHRPSIIAHSFGTYLVAKLIDIYDFQFDKIILCGAILPVNYNWTKAFNEGKAGGVLNQYGGMDFWARIVSRFVKGTGPSGYIGFDDRADGRLIQQGKEEFRHSDYFFDENYDSAWIPFLQGKTVLSKQLRLVASSSLAAHVANSATTALCVLVILFALKLFYFQQNIHNEDLLKRLARFDPELFQSAKSGVFDIARVFPDKLSLDADSAVQDVIRGAESGFDLFTDHGSSIMDAFQADLMEAVKRGVKVRIILLDPPFLEQNQYEQMLEVTHQEKQFLLVKVRTTIATVKKMQEQIDSHKGAYSGSLELRTLRKPLIYRMWIRDPASSTKAMAHVSVLQYRGRLTPPSFRVTKRTSKELVKALEDEFESIWGSVSRTQ